ncbi:MAG: hypothetical protein V3T27_06865 [Alphaproteobacteria bacterium]
MLAAVSLYVARNADSIIALVVCWGDFISSIGHKRTSVTRPQMAGYIP